MNAQDADRNLTPALRAPTENTFAYVFLFVGLLFVYLPALRGSFLIDDIQYFSENVLIRNSPSPAHFWTWTNQADYWPLFYTILWYLWRFFGPLTLPYHLLNVGLQFTNACLFGRILELYGLRRWKLWGVFLFAFHPLTIQAVAWIFQLKTLLSTMFVFLAWLAYARSFDRESALKSYFKSLALFAAAALSKSSVIGFPIALLLHHVWIKDLHPWKTTRRLIPFLGVSVFSGVMTLVVNANTFAHRALWEAPFLERLLVSASNFFFYAAKVFWPWPTHFVYRWHSTPPGSFASWIPSILVAVAAIAVLRYRRRVLDKRSFDGMLLIAGFFALNLAPALGLVSVPYMRYSLVADHYAYLSLAAGLMLVVAFVQSRPALSTGIRTILWAIPVVFAAYDFQVASNYASSEVLWKWAMESNPDSVWARYNLGATLMAQNRFQEALSPLGGAAFGTSDAPEAVVDEIRTQSLFSLGRGLMETGHEREAVEAMERLVSKDSKFPNAAYNLAMIYHQRLGELEKAEKYYLKALESTEGEAREALLPANVNLCNIYVMKKDFVRAKERCVKAAQIDARNLEARINLGHIYRATREWYSVVAVYEGLTRELPPSDEMRLVLGEGYLHIGDSVSARRNFNEALKLNPKNAEARKLLAGVKDSSSIRR